MFFRRLRLGIRSQIMVIVVISAVLTTVITLMIADSSIQTYGFNQVNAQQIRNLKVAQLVLATQYGASVSVSADNQLVIDARIPSRDTLSSGNSFGKLPLNFNTDYVDQVHALLTNDIISVYQCANQVNDLLMVSGQLQCPQISTTLYAQNKQGNQQQLSIKQPDGTVFVTDRNVNTPNNPVILPQSVISQMHIIGSTVGNSPNMYTGNMSIQGTSYVVAYQPLIDPEGHFIGVLAVGEPLTQVTALINDTTLKLLISGILVMIGGIFLAILVASAISNTLHRASEQLNVASSQLSQIAGQQNNGARQQLWAINAINQALNDLKASSNDIWQKTDRLSQVSKQTLTRQHEISPAQFESVMKFMANSTENVNVSSQQQSTTIERMSNAMEAVIEIADQVANSSQETSASTKQLDNVVSVIEELVTGRTHIQQDTLMRDRADGQTKSDGSAKPRSSSRGNIPAQQQVRRQPPPSSDGRGMMQAPASRPRNQSAAAQSGMYDPAYNRSETMAPDMYSPADRRRAPGGQLPPPSRPTRNP